MNDPATCPATKQGRTATGPVTVQCEKPPGHDGRHEGRIGKGTPVYWAGDQHPSASR